MTAIGFIGLGNMGGPMLVNLVKAGHDVKAFDLSPDALAAAVAAGANRSGRRGGCLPGTWMWSLPCCRPGRRCAASYTGVRFSTMSGKAHCCWTARPSMWATAREVAQMAADRKLEMLDAPVSGGTGGAAGGTLTFMVGGSPNGFGSAKPILEGMGTTIIHAGGIGNGQVAKLCNKHDPGGRP